MNILVIMLAESTAIPNALVREGHNVQIVIRDLKYYNHKNYPSFFDRVSCGGAEAVDAAFARLLYRVDLLVIMTPNSLMTEHIDRAFKLCGENVPVIGPDSNLIAEMENNRGSFKQACSDVGVDFPSSHVLHLSDLTDNSTLDSLTYPVVLKPYTYAEAVDSDEKFLVVIARDKQEVLSFVDAFSSIATDFNNPRVLVERFVSGFEIACGAFFNGSEFVGPWLHMMEYKRFAAGDVGPNVDEPGVHNVVVDNPESDLLVHEVKKFSSKLQQAGYHGFFDINFIVEDRIVDSWDSNGSMLPATGKVTAYAIEADCRFPMPATVGIISESDFGKTLLAVATGESSLPWYPSKHVLCAGALHIGYPFCYNLPSTFHGHLMSGMYLAEDVYDIDSGGFDPVKQEFFTKPMSGYLFAFAGFGSTIQEAIRSLRDTFNQVKYPYMYYRTDIGSRGHLSWKK